MADRQAGAPHNTEAEESVLGAMLLSSDAIGTAVESLTAEHFYNPANGLVFASIEALYGAASPVDYLTVADHLERSGSLASAGGTERLVALEAATPTLGHVGRYVRIVEDMALLRRLIGAGSEIVELGRSRPEEPRQAVDAAEALIFKVAQHQVTDSTTPLADLVDSTLTRLEDLYASDGPPAGLRTGFTQIDNLLAGISASSLVVVGGRPSMGKTSFALSVAHNVVMSDRPVLFFSVEMGDEEVAGRLISQDARVDATKFRTGHLSEADWGRVATSSGRLGEAPMWIDDNPSVTVAEIRAKARRLRSRIGSLGLIVVDYLQLMVGRSTAENRQVEIAEISRGLKVLAREMETPVMALSQLSRNLESRGDKRPMLSDLRESGAIEQDADVVMFVYRDEVYDPDSADKGLAEVIVAKHRNGPTGTARLAFLPAYTKFADLAAETDRSAN